jgi:hypothetical protein
MGGLARRSEAREVIGLFLGIVLTRVPTAIPDSSGAGRHEMLNETNRDEVTANPIAWLDRVCPSKP